MIIKHILNSIIICLIQFTISALGSDILEGKGMSASQYSDWKFDQSSNSLHVIDIIQNTKDSDEYFIKLFKPEDKKLSFLDKDGFYLNYTPGKYTHLRFYYSSTYVETEDTNLRLKDPKTDRTVVSFRCGHAGFVRVNDNQMVSFYNNTLSTKTSTTPKWTKCDITLDWNEEKVKVYLNDKYKAEAEFYHKDVDNIGRIQLYNLKPNTLSYFKDIEICQDKCPGFVGSEILKSSCLILLLVVLLTII